MKKGKMERQLKILEGIIVELNEELDDGVTYYEAQADLEREKKGV